MPASRGREQEAEEGRGVPRDLIDGQLAATRGVIRVRGSESLMRKSCGPSKQVVSFNERCGDEDSVTKPGRQREGRRDVSKWTGLRRGLKLYKREERGNDCSQPPGKAATIGKEFGMCMQPNATSVRMLKTSFLHGTSFPTGSNHIHYLSCEIFSQSFRRSHPALLCTPSGCGRCYYMASLG